MKLVLVVLILFSFIPIAYANIIINEVMYNPAGSDNNQEFVELYHEQWLNFSDYIVGDISSNDTLQLAYFYNSSYSLIVEEGFNYSGINASIYSVGATIGNNLNNDGDNISIYYPNGSLIDFLSYSSSWGGDDNGYSLEKINPNLTKSQESWGASLVENGTPGRQNSIYGTGDVDYSVISISEFLPNPVGDDNAPMPDGEWIELYNPANSAIDLRWLFFKDLFGHNLYITDTTVKDESTIIPANGYLVVYTNGQSGLLNNEGIETLAFYDKSANLIRNVSYADPVEGNSYAYVGGIGWQHTKPTPNEANADYSGVNNSYLSIEGIYDLGSDGKAKFGQTIRLKLQVYKGDTTKDSIALWIEGNGDNRLSKESKTNVYTKYTNYSLTLPAQIKPNCDYEFDDGSYLIKAEGLGLSASKEIEIDDITDDLCETELVYVDRGQITKKFDYSIIDIPNEIENGREFAVEVKLANNDDKTIEADVWSYVYRGPKSYSGERGGNLKHLTLKEDASHTVLLKNKVEDAEPGDYKLKVNIKRDDQKTTKDITEGIRVISKGGGIRIADFYTDAKKHEDEISLIAEVENNFSENANINLILESSNTIQIENITANKNSREESEFFVRLYPGNNLFLLKLEKDNKTIDMRDIILFSENNEIKTFSATSSLLGQLNNKSLQKITLGGSLEDITGNTISLEKAPKVVYESANIRTKKMITYFIIGLATFLNIVLIWKR